MDISKLKPEDLKKLAAMSKKGTSASASFAKIKKTQQSLDKDGKALAELTKKNPEL